MGFPEERRFPILESGGHTITWATAEKVHTVYARRGHTQTLERIVERGGFAENELDDLFPQWREYEDENARLRVALAEAEKERDKWRQFFLDKQIAANRKKVAFDKARFDDFQQMREALETTLIYFEQEEYASRMNAENARLGGTLGPFAPADWQSKQRAIAGLRAALSALERSGGTQAGSLERHPPR